jgi:lysozyme family protein
MTPDQRYARCEALVVAYEGGATYTNNPLDAGGPTKFGVTLATLSNWRGCACSAADVQALTPTEACDIYKADYWVAVAGDQLPAGVDLLAFDTAVNMGPGVAVQMLQQALGIIGDGKIGPQTLAAIAAITDPSGVIDRVRARRAARYASLPSYRTFGAGWMSRLNSCANTAKAWATKASAPVPVLADPEAWSKSVLKASGA